VRRRREKEKGVPEATAAHTKTEASDGVEQELESQEKLSLPTLDRACRGGALRGLWRKGGRNRGLVPFLSRLRRAPCTVVGMGGREAAARHWMKGAVALRVCAMTGVLGVMPVSRCHERVTRRRGRIHLRRV
jgi:hypothetical protein